MTTTYEKDQHSRSSSDTNVPDLEKGEARPEEQEEKIVQDNVCSRILTSNHEAVLTCHRSHSHLRGKLAQTSRSTYQERVRRRINYLQRSTLYQISTTI
jgi:hypothetical protein